MPQRLFALLLCAALLISAVPPALAEDQPIEAERFVAPTLPPDAIAWDKNHPDILDEDMLYAHSAILIEADTGEVLFEKNADEIMFPASTTKIMTAYIALQMSDLENDVVTVSQNAIDLVPPTYQTIPLIAGEQVPMLDLISVMLIRSGNEAANAVAEYELVATRSIAARADAPLTLEQIEAYTAQDESPWPRFSWDLLVPPGLILLALIWLIRFIRRHRKKRIKAPKIKPIKKKYLR